MSTHTITGTAKVGRWEYPATLEVQTGTTMRNTKRDGSGEWVREDRSRFVAHADSPEALEDVYLRPMYRIFSYVFESFASEARDIHSQTSGLPKGWTAKQTTEALRELARHGLVTRTESGSPTIPVWQASVTYDNISPEEARVWFDVAMAAGPSPEAAAQLEASEKPVKAPKRRGVSWEPGTECPQGHVLAEDDVYTMPSGRRQCRKCRAGYDSNI